MELFGFEIKRKSKTPGTALALIEEHPKRKHEKNKEQLFSTDADGIIGRTKTFGGVFNRPPENNNGFGNWLATNYVANIVWPNPEGLDKYKSIRYMTIIEEFIGNTRKLPRGYFDVCVISEMSKLFKFDFVCDYAMVEFHEKLRDVHCKQYVALDRTMILEMAAMLTYIFTGGNIIKPNLPDSIHVAKTECKDVQL